MNAQSEEAGKTASRRIKAKTKLWRVRALMRLLLERAYAAADLLWPKAPQRIVFGENKGETFSGGCSDLFCYMAAQPDADVYWFTGCLSVALAVNAIYPGRAVLANSLRALLIGLSSRLFVISHSRRDLGVLAYCTRKKFIQLTHGTGVKTIGFTKVGQNIEEMRRESATYSRLVSLSTFDSEVLWRPSYGLSSEQVWITGAPRNDKLFTPDTSILVTTPLFQKKVILFAPTFRDWGLLENYLPVGDICVTALLKTLEEFDAILLIRPHPYDAAAGRKTVDVIGSSRVQMADSETYPEVTTILPFVDILITDYSSVYVDFLLLDRPMIFTPTDLDKYKADRGHVFDYEAHTPGAKVVSGEEFLNALRLELSAEDPYRDARAILKRKFHEFSDGRSTERVAAQLQAALGMLRSSKALELN
ncbi:MAG: hypothetical protein EON58_14095 [Alphaproteobacteria bacterium]|nr:MAG: hypothetical protein EON58_14095 [Alphaproteobacteria bacterium]